MKKLLLTASMLFLLIIAKGQTTNPDVGELEPKAKPDTPRLPVQILVEKEASFPGDKFAVRLYQAKLEIPKRVEGKRNRGNRNRFIYSTERRLFTRYKG